jgi:hypothetical protein
MERPRGRFDPFGDGGGEVSTRAVGEFAAAGLSIFPVDMRPGSERFKQPLYGYRWKQRATSVLSEVVDDFVEAERVLGIDGVGIGWALGQDGYLALDLDGEKPEWWSQLARTGVNRTPRGGHLIYRQPQGRRIGNGTSRFPSQGWGEVRGDGGYIIVWGRDRPGFDVEQLRIVVDFPHPEWLTDASDVDSDPCTPAKLLAFNAAHTTGRLGPIGGFESKLAQRALGSSRNGLAVEVACWMAREIAAGAVPAEPTWQVLETWWASLGPEEDAKGTLKTRRLALSELRRIQRWAVGQLTPERVEEVKAKTAAWDVEQKAEQEALSAMLGGGSSVSSATMLPERFWRRAKHARVREAAFAVGVSPEALMLAVLVAVAAHIPQAVVFPGRRRGVPNLLVAVIGEPGTGKGTALDRAFELVPLPRDARRYKPGTAQGLVKEFFEPGVDPNDAKKSQLVRHPNAVVLRVDEVAKFAAATGKNNDHGANLLAELKSSIFGEELGQSVATIEKNLRVAALSYRFGGVMGVAPSKHAGNLFDDVDGGLPQRLLWAILLRPEQQPNEALEPFEDVSIDDVAVPDGGGQYVPLRPLVWPRPQPPGPFEDSVKVAAHVKKMLRAPRGLLDAHTPYLAHAVAAVLAYFDGRWTIQPDDLTMALDVVDVSRAARGELLGWLERSAADGRKIAQQRRIEEAVATAAAVRLKKADLDLIDGARGIVATVRQRTEEDGRSPTKRDLVRGVNDSGRWGMEFEEAKQQGWLRVESQPTGAGGSDRQAVIVTEQAP